LNNEEIKPVTTAIIEIRFSENKIGQSIYHQKIRYAENFKTFVVTFVKHIVGPSESTFGLFYLTNTAKLS